MQGRPPSERSGPRAPGPTVLSEAGGLGGSRRAQHHRAAEPPQKRSVGRQTESGGVRKARQMSDGAVVGLAILVSLQHGGSYGQAVVSVR